MTERNAGRLPWTEEEDTALRHAVEIHGDCDKWMTVASYVPGRTNKACRKRWLHSLNPNLKKSAWTPTEDHLLTTLFKQHGSKWSAIARQIPGRTDDACSKRYREALDPSLKKEEWTSQEDAQLAEIYARLGSSWGQVGQELSRSGLSCRNRWRFLQRRNPQFKVRHADNCGIDDIHFIPETAPIHAVFEPLLTPDTYRQTQEDASSTGSTSNTPSATPSPNAPTAVLPSISEVATLGNDVASFYPQAPPGVPFIVGEVNWAHMHSYMPFGGSEFDGSLIEPDQGMPDMFCAQEAQLPYDLEVPPWPVYGLADLAIDSPASLVISPIPNEHFLPSVEELPQEDDAHIYQFDPPVESPTYHLPSPLSSPLTSPTPQHPPDLPRPIEAHFPEQCDPSSVTYHSPVDASQSVVPRDTYPIGPLLERPSFFQSLPSSPSSSPTSHPPLELPQPVPTHQPEQCGPSPVQSQTTADSSQPTSPRIQQSELPVNPGSNEPNLGASCSRERSERSRSSTRPSKRRKANVEDERLSSSRAVVTTDSYLLAYACGHPDCWPTGASEGKYCYATSRELSDHFKAHQTRDCSLRPFKCALAGCHKSWKNLNGLQYHLQVSSAHFKQAVLSSSSDPTPDREEPAGDEKVYRCDVEGCRKVYRQLSGLKYHRTKGHPPTVPTQLEVVPPSLARRLADPKKKKNAQTTSNANIAESQPP